MNSPDYSTGSKASRAISKSLPGKDFLRYYPAHRLMAWQPQGTLDDLMLDQIADWLVDIEQEYLPFKRFVDFSQLTAVAVHWSRGRANCVVLRRLGEPGYCAFIRVADGRDADRGARFFRSRQGGGMARHSSQRSKAEG